MLECRSRVTLFEQVAPDEPVLAKLLNDYYVGERDPATLTLLAG